MLKKISSLLTAVSVGLMSFFATASVAPVTVALADNNILDGLGVDGQGNLSLGTTESTSASDTFNTIYSKYKVILNGVIGLVTISLVLLFVIQCAKLGASADNAARRSTSISALLWIGVSAGLLGAVYTFIGLFYNLFNG